MFALILIGFFVGAVAGVAATLFYIERGFARVFWTDKDGVVHCRKLRAGKAIRLRMVTDELLNVDIEPEA